jgi:hypothetical protein
VVRWVPLRAVEGQVKLDAQGIDWSSLQAHHGEAGVAHCSYAYAEFAVRGRRRALVAAERVSRFWLNGRAGFGDGPSGLVMGDHHLLWYSRGVAW